VFISNEWRETQHLKGHTNTGRGMTLRGEEHPHAIAQSGIVVVGGIKQCKGIAKAENRDGNLLKKVASMGGLEALVSS